MTVADNGVDGNVTIQVPAVWERYPGRNSGSRLVCKVPTLRWEYPEGEGYDEKKPMALPCNEDAWVTWTLAVDPSFQIATAKEAGEAAYLAKWQLECAAGHVLAADNSDEGGDPYLPQLLGTVEPVESTS